MTPSLTEKQFTSKPLADEGALEIINGSRTRPCSHKVPWPVLCPPVPCLYNLTNVLFWELVHPLKIQGVVYGNSSWIIWFGRRPSDTTILASVSRNSDFAPFHFPCLSLTESPITKHHRTFPVEIVTLSSHHRS